MVKELDFDELDRAVSNLMGSVAKPSDDSDKEPAATLSSPTTSSVSLAVPINSEPPTVVPEAPKAEPSPGTTERHSSRVVVPTQRSSGRFMDVVHPSGDMKQSRSLTPPSREGIAITPRPSVAAAVESAKPSEAAAPPVSHDIMPDPISLAESAKPSVTPLSMSGSGITVLPRDDDQKASAAIADSPFLPDTKVEKRPLGNQPPTGGEDKDLLSSEIMSTDKDDGNPPIPLPAELANDLVTIESKELTAAHAPVMPELEKMTVPSGPTSITQQYKEQPSSGDDSHAAIYDAASVPQPLAHPTKKKAGWLWIVWVVLLLALGGGGAALLYATGIIP